MREEELYRPIKNWLESQNCQALVTGGKRIISLWTGPLLPKAFIEPDIVGLKGDSKKIIAVEAKADSDKIIEGIGQCCVYQIAADLVYLALPEEIANSIRNPKIFKQLKIGLLKISKTKEIIQKEIGPLGFDKYTVKERLAPDISAALDYVFHQQLIEQIKQALYENQTPVSEWVNHI